MTLQRTSEFGFSSVSMMRSGEPDGGGLEDLDVYGHVHIDCACSQLELFARIYRAARN